MCYILNYIKKLLPDAPSIKKSQWHDYYISSKRKKQKGYLCSQWNWNAFYQSNYKQKHAFSHIIQKAVDNNLSEEKTETLTCDRWNYSQPTPPLHHTPHPSMTYPTPPNPSMTHPTPPWPTSPLHDTPHPSMTHPIHTWPTTPHTPPWHTPPHPCMTHPTCAWPTHPHPYWGAPFGGHAAVWLFHLQKLFCKNPNDFVL